jgi:hypothetical protein
MFAHRVGIVSLAFWTTLGAGVCVSKPLFDPNRTALYTQAELWLP